MQPQRSLWKLLIIGFFAFLVVACKPIASFSVSPNPVKAGVEATFDASSTMVDVLPKGNKAKSYAWSFGDGAVGSGVTAKHTYAAAGTFKVKLTVIDSAGRKGEATENVVVTAGDVVVDPTTTALKVITRVAGGGLISGATVTVGSTASGTSNEAGIATLAAPIGADQVVKVSKAGFVTQSVRATLAASAEPRQLLVTLMPEKEALAINAIQDPQVIASSILGASVRLPANALVDADTGAPATGPATLKLTPWDISGTDLQAMPANGVARNTAGEIGKLISAGMMTVDFFSAAGKKLQLAPGKSAVIQMDLPRDLDSIDGNDLVESAAVPMWHFDEANGIWVEEGVGEVVYAGSGLAVRATVNHFSTWNWDYFKGADAGSVTVSCESSTGVAVACDVVADVTLADGSKFSRTTSLPNVPTNIINMPAAGTIQWSAVTASGLLGTTTSQTNGTVVINLSPAKTSNFVQCKRPGNIAVACDVTLTATLAAGGNATATYKIPASGSLIETTFDTVGDLNWSAASGLVQTSNTQWSTFSGAAISPATGNVSIALGNPVSAATSFPIQLSCDPNGTRFELSETSIEVPLSTCQLTVNVYNGNETSLISFEIANGLQGPVTVYLPPAPQNGFMDVSAQGNTAVPLGSGFSGGFSDSLSSLVPNQSIVIKLISFGNLVG